MSDIRLSSSAAEIDAAVARSGSISGNLENQVNATNNVEDVVLEIARYMAVRDTIEPFRGFAMSSVTVSSTQIRPLLQRKYHVKLMAQCLDFSTKRIFYATKALAATQNIELDQTISPGTFEKSNGSATFGDVNFQIVNGGVTITPSGNVRLLVIKAS